MSKIGIIIQREFNQRVRKKSFIITTILTPILMIGLIAAPILIAMAGSSDEKTIVVVDESGVIAGRLQDGGKLRFRKTDKSAEELRRNREENVFGYLAVGKDIVTNPSDITLYSYEPSTMEVERNIASQVEDIIENIRLQAYNIENLPQIMADVRADVSLSTYRIDEEGQDKASSSVLSYGVAYVFGFLIYLFVFIYGGMVMQGVVEEKSSKVLELMVSSVKPFQLMLGKILGIAAVALTQFFIWMVLLFVFGTVLGSLVMPDPDTLREAAQGATMGMDVSGMTGNLNPETMEIIRNVTDLSYLAKLFGGFVIFFIGGYLLYAAMFAAVGSAVDNVADTQQLQLPISMPLILSIIVLINAMNDPNGKLAFWFSLIPFTSPIIMMARIPYGVPFWQLAVSVLLLYGSFVGMVWVAGKIYRVGIFMYGKKPTLKEVVKWARYKN